MQTLTAEQFKKRYGTAGLEAFKQTEAPKKEVRTMTGDIKNQFTSGVDQAKQGYQEARQTNPFSSPLKYTKAISNEVMGGLSAATAPLAPVINSVTVPLGKATDFVGSQIGKSKSLQNFATNPDGTPSKKGQIASDIAETTGNFAGALGTVAGIQETPGLIKGAKDFAIEKTNKAVNTVKNVTKPVTEKVLPSPVDIETQAIKDATPSYSKKLVGEKAVDGVPRVKEGGVISGREVTPTKYEIDAGKALAKVENYPVQGTALEKLQAIEPEIDTQTKALYSSLKNEGILRPTREVSNIVKKAIQTQAKESLVLQSSDPIIKKYTQLLNRILAQNDGTLAGELRVRQAMDKAYRNARGKAAFGSDTASALDEIHGAGRDALNQDIISHAQGTDVKASLKNQWDLMRARDVLLQKAQAESPTGIGRLMQKYPLGTRVIKAVGNATGIGGAVNLISH